MMQRRSRPSRGSFEPNDLAVAYAERTGLVLNEELEGWLDWCEATGKLYVDHQAGFRTWLRHAVQYGRGTPIPAVPLPQPTNVGGYHCPLSLGCDNGWVPDSSPAVRCKCLRNPQTSVRLTVESQEEIGPTKKETPSEESANLTLFTNKVEYSATPTMSR